jgi:hypothetical protein
VDRASAFVDQETLDLIRQRFVPVGISLQEDLKSQDPAGEFFRKIVDQRPEPKHSKQGYYIASPDGMLLKGWMYPRPDDGTVKRNLKEALEAYQSPSDIEPLDATRIDRGWKQETPSTVVVVETRSRVYEAQWPSTNLNRFKVIQKTMGHDRLWILKQEVEALAQGTLSDTLLERILLFHLGDNTRCYIDRWSPEAIKRVHVDLKRESNGFVLEGSALLEQGQRGFDAKLHGKIEVKDGALIKFDVVAYGTGWGKHNGVDYFPAGKFTVGNAFTLARPGISFDVVPVWGYVPEYLKMQNLRVSQVREK